MARKKLTKSSLDELAKRMPILSEALQMTYIGGYDTNDCWWRCIAYLKSCGIDYDADAAMAIASGYYGDNFDENNYAFSGNGHDHKKFASNFFSGSEEGYCSGQILVFNPNTTPGWSGNGTSSHAVIIKRYDKSGNMVVFDPQNPEEGEFVIKRSDVSSGAFVVNVR
ncbi:hypothetical protein [Tannerella forsythia]|jgi:hypothetical protein|uniref:hypothetical protein n=1 Tax=Tannerella forsythia TaxID=28112 RepID=UPI00086DFE6A|nr:hypothetical protein [Tannerella forsythia]SCQ20830.1 hypothetical protein TFUB4_01408 [Tannerella forsythia]